MGTLKIERDIEEKVRSLGVTVVKYEKRRRNPHIFFTIKYGDWPEFTTPMGCSPGGSAERRFLADVRRYMKFGPLTPGR